MPNSVGRAETNSAVVLPAAAGAGQDPPIDRDTREQASRVHEQLRRGREARSRIKLRAIFVVAAAAYLFVLQWVYITVISPTWSYGGLTYARPPLPIWALVTLIALLPSLWLPVSFTRASQWLYLYVYVVAYSPFCLLILFQRRAAGTAIGDALPLDITLLACMCLLGLMYRLPLVKLGKPRMPREAYWIALAAIGAIGYAAVYAAFGAHIHLSLGSTSVAAARLQAGSLLATVPGGSFVGYASTITASAINPFFMAFGARGVLASIAVIVLLIWVTGQKRIKVAGICVVGAMSVGILALVLIAGASGPNGKVQAQWTIYRTVYIPATTTRFYVDFFEHHPKTDFTQAKGFSLISPNPYGNSGLGLVIGRELTGNPASNYDANGNFWADGYASLGLAGMVAETVMLGGAFYLLDAVSQRRDRRLAILSLSAAAINVSNISFFTFFLGSGLLFTIALLYFLPDDRAGRAPSGF
jgi:hypothetical protein